MSSDDVFNMTTQNGTEAISIIFNQSLADNATQAPTYNSFQQFCGNSSFWDTWLLLESSYPKFTECFRLVGVTWIPCLLYILLCVPYIPYLLYKPWRLVSKVGIVVLSKTICTWSLIIITCINLIQISSKDQSQVADSIYVSEALKIGTFVLYIIVGCIERRKGIQTSAVSWLFWAILSILVIIPFYSDIIEYEHQSNKLEFALSVVYSVLVWTELVIASFVEPVEKSPEEIEDLGENPSPECNASFLSLLTFWWVNGVILQGFKKTLQENDIYCLNPVDKSSNLMPNFIRVWLRLKEKNDRKANKEREKNNLSTVNPSGIPLIPRDSAVDANQSGKIKVKGISVLRVIAVEHGLSLLFGLVLMTVSSCFGFVVPVFTEALMGYVMNRDKNHPWKGYVLSLGFFIVKLLASTGVNQARYSIQKTCIRVKASLINAIYRKSLITSNLRDDTSQGQVVNLMAVDCQNIEDSSRFLGMIITDPIVIVVAVYMLYCQMGVAAIAGVAVMVCAIPINGRIGKFIQIYQREQMKFKDERIKLISEILNGIKVLKMYAWELSFQEKIQAVRNMELKAIRKIRVIDAFLIYFFLSLPQLVQVAAFGTYIGLHYYLSPAVAFISFQLFGMMSGPLSFLPMMIPSLLQTKVSLDRISNYLNRPDIKENVVERNENAEYAIEIKNGSFAWNINRSTPTLNNINMQVKPGSLVAIVGAVGSGKSSLISAMLGEMEKLSGTVIVKGSTAYVPQMAWIQNETVRENILFGKKYQQQNYSKVLDACALKSDLNILTAGDQTEIGEKGINISGGQKQRVSLARAVYNDNDIYLMDDPLSAVDSHVGKHLFKEVIGQDGLLKNKTRVLVTHGIQWLPQVDQIYVVNNGEISDSGTYTELLEKGGDFAAFLKEYAIEQNEDESDSNSDASTDLITNSSAVISNEKLPKKDMDEKEGNLTEAETSFTGKVKLSVYAYYIKQAGLCMCLIIILLQLCSVVFSAFTAIWLTTWTGDPYFANNTNEGTSEYNTKTATYLGVYAAGGFIQGLFFLAFAIFSQFRMIHASEKTHNHMLVNVMRSPMSFFDTTPIGRITNRFSRDADVCDNILPNRVQMMINLFGTVIVTVFNISYCTPLFLVAMIPITITYICVQSIYIPTYRQLCRINSVTRSPVYSLFSETLSGVASIRAYRAQDRFLDESIRRVDHNMRFNFTSKAANTWLLLRLDFIGNFIILSAAIFAVAAKDINSSLVGLSISYANIVTNYLQLLVDTVSECESNIVSVERMKEYSLTSHEAPWETEHKADESWPDNGNIHFDHYGARYRPGLDLVLKGVNCSIKGGEKIGIVGRTGAGKSSMTVAMFRIIEPATGRIIIDGEDITQLGLHQLRNKITILPQDPVLFSGTMRKNLDPFSVYSDNKIWSALEHSYLKNFVEGLPQQLEYECGDNGQNLSVGQRQLVCLARTLLRKTKILLLDEATAAVDMETDDLIQKTIKTEFKECTILTIAHRLNTIMDYDRVMVLDQGSIKEFDTPSKLLANTSGTFYGMAKNAGLVS